MNAVGGRSNGRSCGILRQGAAAATPQVSISGGTVKATGGTVYVDGHVSSGISSNSGISVTGGTTVVKGQNTAIDGGDALTLGSAYWYKWRLADSGAYTTGSAAAPFVWDADQSYAELVSTYIEVATSSLGNGYLSTQYGARLAARGGSAPLTWALKSGSSLPAGLSLASSGLISGTPRALGTVQFTVTVTDVNGLTAEKTLSMTVTEAPPPTGDDSAPLLWLGLMLFAAAGLALFAVRKRAAAR